MAIKVRRSSISTVRGIGKPDYTREVSSAKQRAGLSLTYPQSIVVLLATFTSRVAHPYPIPYILPPLAAGVEAHLIDAVTGVATPYTIPIGYTLTLIQWEWTNSEDIELWHYLDGMILGSGAISPAGDNISFNVLAPFSTIYTDPTGALAHTYDVIVVNRGIGALSGTIDFILILEAVGTPPLPTIKKCRCPFCHNIQDVAVGTTSIICTACGRLYIVRDYSKIKEL